MRNRLPLYILPALVIFMQACGGDNQPAKNFNNNKTNVDADALFFIKTAGESGLTEIKASTIAETMSKNLRVINLAKMMIADHTQAGIGLDSLAKDKLVDKTDALSPGHQKKIDSLAKLTSGFDKAYVTMMVNDHVKAVRLFEGASSNKNYAVQQFAKKTLPTLKMHLDSANAVCAGLK